MWRSIQAKFIGIMLPLMALLYVGLVGTHGYLTYVRDCDLLRDRLDKFVASRSIILAEPLVTGQDDQVRLILASMIADRDVAYIAVFDKNGRKIDSFGKPEISEVVFEKKSSITFADHHGVQKVGVLEIKADNHNLLDRLWDNLLFEAIVAAALIFSGIAIAVFGYRRAVGRPLGRLRRAFIAAEPASDRRIEEWQSDDEIGDLFRSYNEMQLRLQREEAALRDIRDKLEERVRERTEKLEIAVQAAEEANQAKSEFLSAMSHELRTPLNAILGFSEVLHLETFGKLGNDTYREYARDIHNSGRYLLDLINDILDISRIEAGQYLPELSEFDIREVVRSACDVVRERAKERRLNLNSQTPDTALAIRADERAIRQILLNLLSNSIKFTEPGGSIELTLTVDSKDHAVIEVSDTGRGIPEDKLENILLPFNQVATNQIANEGATGLGLSIVKALVDLHAGRLEIASELGNGTKVTVMLPTTPPG